MHFYYTCPNCKSIFSAMTLNKMFENDLPCPCGVYPTFESAIPVPHSIDPVYVQETETPLWQVQHAYDNRMPR